MRSSVCARHKHTSVHVLLLQIWNEVALKQINALYDVRPRETDWNLLYLNTNIFIIIYMLYHLLVFKTVSMYSHFAYVFNIYIHCLEIKKKPCISFHAEPCNKSFFQNRFQIQSWFWKVPMRRTHKYPTKQLLWCINWECGTIAMFFLPKPSTDQGINMYLVAFQGFFKGSIRYTLSWRLQDYVHVYRINNILQEVH